MLTKLNQLQANCPKDHFSNPCTLCKCFIEYTHRDQPIAVKPYGVAEDPYDSTEDRCLATCLQDSRCQGVVYGLVGGRDVFTCELYEVSPSGFLGQLIYEPYVNTYLPRSTPCTVPYNHLQTLPLVVDEETSEKRKQRYRKLGSQRNPFNYGR
ncbi:unnamed protein product [Toxocara canis]|uniref:Apple domain-containing protein n=1 Tax=Toxocara canis TaxID=6265 RepID=A0A183UEG8_TOXCA|nr:unnamed protein product [Toxocara canis]